MLFALLCLGSRAEADQTLTVRSGNGPIGSADTQVRVLRYGRTGDVTPAASDFTTVQTAPFAIVASSGCGCYIPRLAGDPAAIWIATTPSWIGFEGSSCKREARAIVGQRTASQAAARAARITVTASGSRGSPRR